MLVITWRRAATLAFAGAATIPEAAATGATAAGKPAGTPGAAATAAAPASVVAVAAEAAAPPPDAWTRMRLSMESFIANLVTVTERRCPMR